MRCGMASIICHTTLTPTTRRDWSAPMMVAPPTNISGTGFPVITAGVIGKVALGYVGDSGNDTWNGYMTIITDAFGENL